MIVRLLRRATKDLHDIGEYIARDNPARAASFLAELMAQGSTGCQRWLSRIRMRAFGSTLTFVVAHTAATASTTL